MRAIRALAVVDVRQALGDEELELEDELLERDEARSPLREEPGDHVEVLVPRLHFVRRTSHREQVAAALEPSSRDGPVARMSDHADARAWPLGDHAFESLAGAHPRPPVEELDVRVGVDPVQDGHAAEHRRDDDRIAPPHPTDLPASPVKVDQEQEREDERRGHVVTQVLEEVDPVVLEHVADECDQESAPRRDDLPVRPEEGRARVPAPETPDPYRPGRDHDREHDDERRARKEPEMRARVEREVVEGAEIVSEEALDDRCLLADVSREARVIEERERRRDEEAHSGDDRARDRCAEGLRRQDLAEGEDPDQRQDREENEALYLFPSANPHALAAR